VVALSARSFDERRDYNVYPTVAVAAMLLVFSYGLSFGVPGLFCKANGEPEMDPGAGAKTRLRGCGISRTASHFFEFERRGSLVLAKPPSQYKYVVG
jgi:hypothetical protein